VGHLDPASEDFAKNCERFAANKLFRGIRVNHAKLRVGLEQPAYISNLRLLVKHDLQLDVNGGPDMPADVAKLAQLLPELRIVINHEANLTIDGKTPPAEWRKGMEASAAGKQVWCKVSALAEGTRRKEGDAPTDLDFYRPVLDALWEIFGADRLIYGSNWPVSVRAAPYATIHSIVNQYFHEKGKAAAEKYFLGNALRAYKPVERSH
jgi:predicted TIM-barrel fold metal-dependent hydrolase